MAPDVILLGSEWPERALLRAQLIEEGYAVVAIDAWPMPSLYRQPGMNPRAMIVDLHGMAEPRKILEELRSVVPPDRVLVVAALGTLTADEIEGLGYKAVKRPVSIGEIAATLARMVSGRPFRS